MKKILLIACMVFAGMSVSAQISTLLEKGKSGIGIKGTYEKSNGFYGFGGRIGGSVAGRLDIEFCYQYHFWDQEKNNLLTDDATSSYYEGRLTYWLIRKEIIPSLEVNFGALAGFDYGPFTNYKYAGEPDGSVTTYDYYMDGQVGLAASINFNVGKNWFLQPTFSVICEFGTQQESTQDEERTWSDNGITSKIGLTIMKRFTNGSAVYLDADTFSETYGTYPFYNFSLGYVLPF